MIRVRGLTKVYGAGPRARRVLDRVDLHVPEGSMYALLGPSGAGKTSLLNVLGGLDDVYEGEVLIGNRALRGLTDKQLSSLRRDTIGYMFQDFHLLESLSALDNVLLSSRFSPAAERRRLAQRAHELLSRVGLQGREADHPSALSGGERQRVALARALLRAPAVVLADEPTGNLDAETGARLIALLVATVREQNAALLVVTHDERVAEHADARGNLQDGRLVCPRAPSSSALGVSS